MRDAGALLSNLPAQSVIVLSIVLGNVLSGALAEVLNVVVLV